MKEINLLCGSGKEKISLRIFRNATVHIFSKCQARVSDLSFIKSCIFINCDVFLNASSYMVYKVLFNNLFLHCNIMSYFSFLKDFAYGVYSRCVELECEELTRNRNYWSDDTNIVINFDNMLLYNAQGVNPWPDKYDPFKSLTIAHCSTINNKHIKRVLDRLSERNIIRV